MRHDKLTTKFQDALGDAQSLALAHDAAYIQPEHLLVAMLEQDGGPALLLQRAAAQASGVDIRLLRAVTVVAATAVTASCVSMCGQVGWVGLLIPHMCRMLFGNNHLSIVPASVSFGAVFMIIVDTMARSISAAEIPVSILTAIIGAPFFIVLMRRSGGWRV